MTSLISKDAYVPTPSEKRRFLEVDKNGFPRNKQVPRISESYSGAGGVTVVPNGSSSYNVLGILAGVLTLNCTDVSNFVGRTLMVTVRPGATQNVVINFPAAGYTVYVKGAAAAVTTYTLAASANAQSCVIDFRTDGAFITV